MDESPGSIYEALVECVRAAGGSKHVAAMLWPAKAARNLDDARRYLASCLDPDRAEKLSLDEILLIMRAARERGCHVAMTWLSRELNYTPPLPIRPRDEADDLRRQMLEMGRKLADGLDRLRQIEERAGRP